MIPWLKVPHTLLGYYFTINRLYFVIYHWWLYWKIPPYVGNSIQFHRCQMNAVTIPIIGIELFFRAIVYTLTLALQPNYYRTWQSKCNQCSYVVCIPIVIILYEVDQAFRLADWVKFTQRLGTGDRTYVNISFVHSSLVWWIHFNIFCLGKTIRLASKRADWIEIPTDWLDYWPSIKNRNQKRRCLPD